ncbi:MAG: DNA polymerase III subunit delta [Gemmatimonadaceae bacterium]
MSASALKIMRDALKRGVFDGAYYICGEDDFQKEDAMRQLTAAAVEPAMRDFNFDVRRSQDFDTKSLDAALSAVPMMADRRVLVMRDVSALRKEPRKILDKYLKSPLPDVMVLMVETSGGKTDTELARSCTRLEFDSLSADRIPKWIAHYASTEFQTKITTDAAELLQGAVGTDLHQLVGELDKLASFTNGREITEADVSAIVGVRRGETMADFLDQVANRNASRASDLVPLILSQPKTSAVALVMALATQTMALSWGRAKLDEGLSQGRLQGEYFNLLKQAGSAFTGRPWGAAAAAWASATSRWTRRSLDHSLAVLLEADIALKDARISSEEQLMATLVLEMCIEDNRSIAA